MEMSDQIHAPAALPPQESPVPIEKEVEWVLPAGLEVLEGENTSSLCSYSDDSIV